MCALSRFKGLTATSLCICSFTWIRQCLVNLNPLPIVFLMRYYLTCLSGISPKFFCNIIHYKTWKKPQGKRSSQWELVFKGVGRNVGVDGLRNWQSNYSMLSNSTVQTGELNSKLFVYVGMQGLSFHCWRSYLWKVKNQRVYRINVP